MSFDISPKMPCVAPNGYAAIDTLCGAGGMTLAQHLAGFNVVAALNHWALALDSQAIHFPWVPHYRANVRTQHAEALGLADWFHMSPDCRDHSRAKGGMPVDPSVRGLAEESPRYLMACGAKVATFENVPEFVEWGPLIEMLDAEGNIQYGIDKETGLQAPLMVKDKTRNGEYYNRWVATMKAMGYVNHEWRVLNSADFGSPQARRRYFGIFTRAGIKITWPTKTHDEYGRGGLPKWRGAIEILEPGNYGKSVFEGKPFVEATLNRLAAGVEQFGGTVAPWLLKYNSNSPSGKANPGYSSYRPLNTLACQRREAVVRPILLHPYYKSAKCQTASRPLPTLTTKDRFLVGFAKMPVPGFSFAHQFGNGPKAISSPLRTLLASRRHQYLGFFHYYSGGGQLSSLGRPLPTILANGHARLIAGLYGPGEPGEKVADCPHDSPGMLRLKAACRKWGIVDLLVRMLTVRESFRGQGFPDWYTLLGTETDKRKMIGNAVEVNTGLAVAGEVRRMLDRFKETGRKLTPLKMRPVLRWEQGDLFAALA